MSENGKKVIPKFKKKLQGFLTDESGKITKEDVFKIGVATMGIAGLAVDVSAGHTSHGSSCNESGTANTVTFGQTSGTATHVNNAYTAGGDCGPSVSQSTLKGTIYTKAGIAPYNVIVNGHANSNATIQGVGFNGGSLTTTAYHGSHSSHGNHSNHENCGRGNW